ncbi:MAG: AAA family ATPase [Acidobacteriota bacterium]
MIRRPHTEPNIESLQPEELRRQLLELARERFCEQVVDAFEIEHLVEIATNFSLLLSDIYDPEKIERILQRSDPAAQWLERLNLPEKPPGSDTILRLRQFPDQVKTVADKCLYDVGVFRRDQYRGVSLTDLGVRAYRMASEILQVLAEDRRLRDYFIHNTLGNMPIEDEVVFLRQCAQRFTVHADLLNQLGLLEGDRHGPLHPRTASRQAPGSAAEPGSTPGGSSPEHTAERGAVAPPAVAALAPVDAGAATQFRRDQLRCEEEEPGPPEHPLVAPQAPESAPQPEQISALERLLVFSVLPIEELRSRLKEIVIDQEAAVDTLCDEFSLYATGTQDPRRPSSYLFVGPTGVGKNYLIESLIALLEERWDKEVPYLLLEGPNYTYSSDINELRGATRGFIRSDEEGMLTKFHHRSSQAPFAVLVVDEVEKAHPQLHRFFLSMMDRGTVTDNRGETLRFGNTLMVFTSNLGYSRLQQQNSPIGYERSRGSRRYPRREIERELKKTLSPEFLNRLLCVHFAPLSRSSIERIFDLEFAKISSLYETIHGLRFEATERAQKELIERGYSEDYGARYLASTLQQYCNVEVSKKLKRDEIETDRKVQPVLEYLREVRAGKRVYRHAQAQQLVHAQARVRVPYRRLRIDYRRGKFVYETERRTR